MKALDLFCGLGGWSDGLAMEGFEVLGVEIEPKIAELYKHKVIVADVRALDGKDFRGYDLIVGSPPCRDFSVLGFIFGKKWKHPPQPEVGLKLVNAFLHFIEDAQPRFWLMENVPRLSKFFDLKPIQFSYLSRTMKRAFWGKYPPFLVPSTNKPIMRHIGSKPYSKDKGEFYSHHPLQSWMRAKIPLPVARALGRAVKNELNGV